MQCLEDKYLYLILWEARVEDRSDVFVAAWVQGKSSVRLGLSILVP